MSRATVAPSARRAVPRRLRLALRLVAAAGLGAAPRPAAALPMVVQYGDAADEGFNDPVLGSARRAAIELAAEIWAQTLGGEAPVVVRAVTDPLGGSGSSAVLASTAATTLHRNFPRAPIRDTWYAAALANQLAGTDVNGGETAEIDVTFNGDVDGATVLGSVGFYYGTDGLPGTDIDFVTIALHELGHGLGFFDTVAPSGALTFVDPGIYDRFLRRPGIGSVATMRRAERLAAMTSGALLWNGPQTIAFSGSAPSIYAPGGFQSGSSLSHWDVSSLPDELLEPFYTGASRDPGLLLPALVDLGWPLAVPSFTPRAARATRTATPTARATLTPTPTGSPAPVRPLAYVTNFDDATVSVIEVASNTVLTTIPVDDGPTGIVASADGRRVYVANFHAATLGVIDTVAQTMIDAIPVGDSANGVALTPDGVVAYVTDTIGDAVSVVDLIGATTIDSIPVGPQPSGIGITATGRAFVANFGGSTLSVIDTASNQVTALIPVGNDPPGLLGIAVARQGIGFATTSKFGTEGAMFKIDTNGLDAGRFFPGEAEAVALHPQGSPVYAAMYDRETGRGHVALIDVDSLDTIRSIGVERVPEALQVSSDGAWLYVANTGSNSLSVIDTVGERVVATVAVGRAPMGIAIAQVPIEPPSPTPTAPPCAGDCDDDGEVTVDDLVLAVRVALGASPLSDCAAVDVDHSGVVTIDELITATRRAVEGCREGDPS